jgi:hypothetical protein
VIVVRALWYCVCLRCVVITITAAISTLPRAKKTGPLFFLTPAIAAQYKTYTVIKINPYGVRQVRSRVVCIVRSRNPQTRMMGIDATRITNFKAGEEEDPIVASSAAGAADASGAESSKKTG